MLLRPSFFFLLVVAPNDHSNEWSSCRLRIELLNIICNKTRFLRYKREKEENRVLALNIKRKKKERKEEGSSYSLKKGSCRVVYVSSDDPIIFKLRTDPRKLDPVYLR